MMTLALGTGIADVQGGGAFIPTQLSGCTLWLRADLGTTIATGVSQWNDQSGTGDSNKNVVQATGSKQPTLTASDAAYNNQATLSFASASLQVLRSGTWSVALTQPTTVIVVGNWTVNSGGRFIDGLTQHTLEILDNGASSGISIDASVQLSAGASSYDGSKAVICGVFNGASSKIFKNNSQTPLVTGNAGATGATGTEVGAEANGSNYLNGKIAEVIIYNKVLALSDQLTVFQYLGTRYNISVS